jgi:type III pantothenate kinase
MTARARVAPPPRPPRAPLLLVDIGNSRIKWARCGEARRSAGSVAARGTAAHGVASLSAWQQGEFARATLAALAPISRILVASVAAPAFDARFAREARRTLDADPEFVASTARAVGVVNAYGEPWRLGVDRWVGAIAGHHLFRPARDVCIVDIGTAMTVDLVDSDGRHRGGAIVPGPDLMVRSLLLGTSGIRRRAAGVGSRARQTAFARNTRDALESGARRAAAATVDRFAAEARDLLGRAAAVILTGGAAPQVAPLVRGRHRLVPDLVLRGLAVLAVRPP